MATKAPLLPNDFNEQYNNAAHESMQLHKYGYFRAGDILKLYKLLKGDAFQNLLLPNFYFKGCVEYEMDFYEFLLEMDTVIVDARAKEIKDNAIYISYRKRIKKRDEINKVTLEMYVPKEFTQKQKQGE